MKGRKMKASSQFNYRNPIYKNHLFIIFDIEYVMSLIIPKFPT